MAELGRADAAPLLEEGWVMPERVVTKGEDGLVDIYGILLKPNGPSNGTYPVVEQTYAGPHGFHCPKGFSLLNDLQPICGLGMAVVWGAANMSRG